MIFKLLHACLYVRSVHIEYASKIFLVRIIENNRIDPFFCLVQVSFAPLGQERDQDKALQGQSSLQGLEVEKTPPQIIFNNPRSSIKPEIAPDTNHILTQWRISWKKTQNNRSYNLVYLSHQKLRPDYIILYNYYGYYFFSLSAIILFKSK